MLDIFKIPAYSFHVFSLKSSLLYNMVHVYLVVNISSIETLEKVYPRIRASVTWVNKSGTYKLCIAAQAQAY